MDKEKISSAIIFGVDELVDDIIIKNKLRHYITDLIVNHNTQKFYFTKKNSFENYCLEIISNIQIFYPNIKKVLILEKSDICHSPKSFSSNNNFSPYDKYEDVYTNKLNTYYKKNAKSFKAIELCDFVAFVIKKENDTILYSQPEFEFSNKLNKTNTIIC